jgi:hypothetical protein
MISVKITPALAAPQVRSKTALQANEREKLGDENIGYIPFQPVGFVRLYHESGSFVLKSPNIFYARPFNRMGAGAATPGAIALPWILDSITVFA